MRLHVGRLWSTLILTALAGLAPIFVGLGGGLAYAAVAALTGSDLLFVLLAAPSFPCRGLAKRMRRKMSGSARNVFGFSIFYLFVSVCDPVVRARRVGMPNVLALWAMNDASRIMNCDR